MHAGFQCCLAMTLIQCHEFGPERRTFEQLPKLHALQYDQYIFQQMLILKFCFEYGSQLISFVKLCQSLKLLSVMAAIRLDDDVDSIETTLSSALMDAKNNAAVKDRSIIPFDPLASNSWEKVTFSYC